MNRSQKDALKIAALYALLGILWVTVSDFLLEIAVEKKLARPLIQTAKGWTFVLISAALAFFLTRSALRQREHLTETLAQSEEKFRTYIENAPLALLAVDRQGFVLDFNPAAMELFGHDAAALSSMRILDFALPEDQASANRDFATLIADGHRDVEYRLNRPDGRFIWALIRAVKVGEDRYIAFCQDITERRKAEETLRRSEERYRAVVEDQTEIISRFNSDGALTFVNEVYLKFFGKTAKELLENGWQPMAVPEDVPMIEERLRMLSPEQPLVVIENRVYSGDGKVHWMQFNNRGFFDLSGKLTEVQSVGRDITERKRGEETLHRYGRRLIEMEEDLRRKLAAELHDEIGRDLTALGIDFSIVRGALPKEARERLKSAVQDSERLFDEIGQRVRNMMTELRPPLLDDYGLPAALRWYTETFSVRTGIRVSLVTEDSFPRFTEEEEMAVFRIAQEALNNAARHAGTETLTVSLKHAEGKLRLSVIDDGKGFAPQAPLEHKKGSAWGLTIMRERAEAINGVLLLDSEPGKGTIVSVELPGGP